MHPVCEEEDEVPAMFVAGEKDWVPHQYPGVLDAMKRACMKMGNEDVVFVRDAGHWVQQENPESLLGVLPNFLAEH